MVAYGRAMRPSLVDVMAETNTLADEMDKKIVLIVNYPDSVWPARATLEHTDGTAVTYDELASIGNTVVIAFDTHWGFASLADIQKQIDDSIEITYQASRYDDTEQAIIYYTVTVHVESGVTPTVNVETDVFSGGSYTLPTASATQLGGVKVGSGLAIDSNGVLSTSGGSGDSDTPVFANATVDTNGMVTSIAADYAEWFATKNNDRNKYVRYTISETSSEVLISPFYVNYSESSVQVQCIASMIDQIASNAFSINKLSFIITPSNNVIIVENAKREIAYTAA